MIFLRSPIGKVGSSLCSPHFLKRGQDELRGTFQKYYLCHPFFACLRFLFYLEIAGNINFPLFKINRVCFYCSSGLEFIGYSSKSL